jgi:hypothetical protein
LLRYQDFNGVIASRILDQPHTRSNSSTHPSGGGGDEDSEGEQRDRKQPVVIPLQKNSNAPFKSLSKQLHEMVSSKDQKVHLAVINLIIKRFGGGNPSLAEFVDQHVPDFFAKMFATLKDNDVSGLLTLLSAVLY